MMPFDSAEFFKNSIDCVKGNIVKWRKEQEQRNLNLECLQNKIRDSENRMYIAEMKLEMMTERKEVAENEAALLKEAYEKVSSENFKMCSESCRIENELQEEKSSKAKLQEEMELLKAKLEKLQNKNRRLKDERNDVSRDKVLLEGQLTDKSNEYESILSEMQNANDTMQDITSKCNEAQRTNTQLRNQLKEQRRAARSWEEKYKLMEAKKMEEFVMLEKVYKEAKQENNELREKLNEHIKEYQKLKDVCDEEMRQRFSIDGIMLDLQQKLTETNKSKDESVEKLKLAEDLFEETKKRAKESDLLVASQKDKLDLASQTISKFDELLSAARAELKNKIDECSELQKSQLATEFELKESRRNHVEIEIKLKHMQDYTEALSKRNIELEAEVDTLKFQLLRDTKGMEDSGWDEDDSDFVAQTVERLRLSRKNYEDFKEEISTHSESIMVQKLKNDLKEKENSYKNMAHQLNLAKQELEGLNHKDLPSNNARQLDIFDEDEDEVDE